MYAKMTLLKSTQGCQKLEHESCKNPDKSVWGGQPHFTGTKPILLEDNLLPCSQFSLSLTLIFLCFLPFLIHPFTPHSKVATENSKDIWRVL